MSKYALTYSSLLQVWHVIAQRGKDYFARRNGLLFPAVRRPCKHPYINWTCRQIMHKINNGTIHCLPIWLHYVKYLYLIKVYLTNIHRICQYKPMFRKLKYKTKVFILFQYLRKTTSCRCKNKFVFLDPFIHTFKQLFWNTFSSVLK
jgi:hypothetical protein